MKNKRVYITSLHGLKSNKEYDFTQNIMECTHEMIHFTIYNDDNDTSKGWTSYSLIVSNEELFDLLKNKATVEIQPDFNRLTNA